MKFFQLYFCTVLLLVSCSSHKKQNKSSRPNVILIMTDDQGYSNLGCQGHPNIKTPNIDKFAEDAISLTHFHTELLCAPSRAALMTGRYSARTGAWRTSAGRALMRSEEITIAELFKASGYQTGHFGKWHLGDNFPFRSEDQGFDEVVVHRSGGVGQLVDYWGNTYFDDTYCHNGKPEKYKGYCADVWFNETMRYIKEVKDEPFFIYLASNTPHSPYKVAPKYAEPYLKQGLPEKRANYFGMIANMDENMGRLLKFLDYEKLSENTIVVFTTDDGASAGAFNTHDKSVDGFPVDGFNSGMRGRKASAYEGGHRTFCFIKLPNQKKGNEIDINSGVWDIFPTLADFCDVEIPKILDIDGKSLKSAIEGKESKDLNDRTMFVQLHGGVGLKHLKGAPHHYLESAVIKNNWRLVNGKELYNLENDLLQENDIASIHPKLVTQLQNEYKQWFKQTTKRINKPCRFIIGDETEPEVELTADDLYMSDGNSPFAANHVNNLNQQNGPWKIKVANTGIYLIQASRYPVYANIPFGINSSNQKKNLAISKVRLKAGEQIIEKEAGPNDLFIEFEIELAKSNMDLQSWMIDDKGQEYPCYFLNIIKQ